MREKLILRCSVCQEHNYTTKKNKSEHPDKVEFNKYCSRCNSKTNHKEYNKFK